MQQKDIAKKNDPPLSVLRAFATCKCPRCRLGDVYSGSAYNFKQQKMKEVCSVCLLKFEREPGYFYVSMFISYAMNVAEIITIAVASYVLGLDIVYENLWYFVGIIFLGVALLSPFNSRYSRMILLYFLSPGLHYDPSSVSRGQVKTA
ncbi:DUF983 domain-containing protein [Pedobacter jamesrossensis]|uniref:DUF983 domain-containing protein n=1 Tax=Pedobacter jamesrossensis TaxID=1908238 RepID=A0ABV8NLC4_9SPHI